MIIRHRFFLLLMLSTGFLLAYISIKHPLAHHPVKSLKNNTASHSAQDNERISKIIQMANGADSSISLLKNDQGILPLNDLEKSTTYLQLGDSSDVFNRTIQLFDTARMVRVSNSYSHFSWDSLQSQRLVLSLHLNKPLTTKDLKDINLKLSSMPLYKESILMIFGEIPDEMAQNFSKFHSVVVCPDNTAFIQDRAGQKLMGAMSFNGKITHGLGNFPPNSGLETAKNGRLRFALPEEFGISGKSFDIIDQLAVKGITQGAYPSCQIVIAYKGAILYRKAFGSMTYDKTSIKVTNTHLYDIASITKIASSTLAAMHLVYEGKLDIQKSLKDYLSDWISPSNYGNINITQMMCHQAGLEAFIPFYLNTLSNGIPSSNYYNENISSEFPTSVADGLFLKNGYRDSMYAQILSKPLHEKKYLYSDLCYFFLQPILEKITASKQNDYVDATFYKPMGLKYTGYLPLKRFPRNQIVPTENDQYFRKQLLWGYVHDPGAAMLGGVGGHAGLFSNATDLANIMQLFLNNGIYAGHRYFDESLRKKFTSAVFSGNKRGIGFDRPNNGGGGTCDISASPLSFGHSGFTGCLAWADPKNESIYVFLSNRVHPSQDNWKIRDLNIRTDIQHAMNQILAKAK